MPNRGLTIAIDGPGSSGKGTVARSVARVLGYQYVDTGAMYRAVALSAQQRGVAWTDEPAVAEVARSLQFAFTFKGESLRIEVDGRDISETIRTPEIGRGASDVSKLPAVRTALLDLQQSLGAEGSVVMDGRDIGTVVLPGADLKIYLDASLDVRARRRHLETKASGDARSYQRVRADLQARDAQDMGRDVAPLRLADDGVVLDTTNMRVSEATDAVLILVKQRLDSGSSTR